MCVSDCVSTILDNSCAAEIDSDGLDAVFYVFCGPGKTAAGPDVGLLSTMEIMVPWDHGKALSLPGNYGVLRGVLGTQMDREVE